VWKPQFTRAIFLIIPVTSFVPLKVGALGSYLSGPSLSLAMHQGWMLMDHSFLSLTSSGGGILQPQSICRQHAFILSILPCSKVMLHTGTASHLAGGRTVFNPLNTELNSICYLLALLRAHHFLHVSRIRVKLLTFRLLMSYIYIYGAPILDVSRSHTTTQHSR